ncbi:AMP-binding protein [Streptomyces sp. NPDC093097]|uniref:AMP-binding protein n=1 Tax=Streptomyces sp. NPDC093097 TaxID=3366027 RepID=UPI00380C143C
MFDANVSASPHAPAVRTPQGTTSYEELAQAALAVETALRLRGVVPGDRIGIVARPGPGFLSAMLAAATLRLAYVPLDVRHTSARLHTIVQEASCVCLVVDEAGAAVLGTGTPTLHLDEVKPVEGSAPDRDTAPAGDGDACLYAMFTSGSTGRPKGVLINHASVAQLVTAATEDLDIPRGAVWSWTHSPSVGHSTWETWGALLTGGCVAVPEEGTDVGPEELCQFVVEQRVNVFSQTPSSFQRLTTDARLLGMATSSEHLSHIVFGGEGLPSAIVEPWVRMRGFASPRLVNMYGSTETTVHSTFHVLNEDSLAEPHVPVGHALTGRCVTVRDAGGTPVEPGGIGELFVGGHGLAIDYLDDPEATARAFVTLPGEGGAPERVYRSGDLGRVDPRTGLLHHCGRADHQVKISGHRVAPEEVAAAVSRIDGVRDAVVRAVVHPVLHEPRLVAYVWPDEDAAEQPMQYFRERTRALVPPYLVPSHFVPVDGLHLTVSGRLDPAWLPLPWSDAPAGSGVEEPWGEQTVEQILTAAFAQVLSLKADTIEPDADFFSLGGDSILAATVFTTTPRLRERLALRDLFTTTTVHELARLWHQRAPEPPGSGNTGVSVATQNTPAEPPARVLPLTRAQQGIIYDWSKASSGAYQDGLLHLVELPGTLDDIVAGIRLLHSAHPVLRARLRLERPGRELDLTTDTTMSVIGCDDGGKSVEEGMLRARRWIEERRAERMDVAAEPLFHFRVGLLQDGFFSLAVVAHHVVSDGWSLSVLLRDLYDVCLGHRLPDELTTLAADHQRVLAALPELERRDIATLTRPVGTSAPARPNLRPLFAWAVTATGATHEVCVHLDDQLIGAARAFARTARVPLKTVFVAAHLRATQTDAALLHTVCIPVSGRPDLPGGDTCVGFFVRPRLLEVRLRRDDSAQACAQRVWDAERRLLETRFAPLSVQLSSTPDALPPVLFNYVDFHVLNSVSSAIRSSEEFDENTFPLTIEVAGHTETSGGPTRYLVRAMGPASTSLLEQLAAEHVTALRQLVAPYGDGGNA